MTFRLTFKTPDVVDQLCEYMDVSELSDAVEFTRKFIKYGEYITIEFDTEKGTAVVV